MKFSLLSGVFAAFFLAAPGCAQTNAQNAKPTQKTPAFASGVVFHDQNGNRKRDAGEKGIPNIGVSNGLDIVSSDPNGAWRLPASDDCIFFVVKPRGWMTPVSAEKLPRFYYIHKPKGSPRDLKYAGVAPTGPLPTSIDFPLSPQKEPEKFKAILFGDPQPRNEKEVNYLAHDIVEELVGTDAAFGVSLGDIAFNNLDVYDSLNRKIALIGIPWYNVIGNHDINQEANDDAGSDETWERVFGPSYYSFDYGAVHFMVLDDISWVGKKAGQKKFFGGFGARQMKWIENDLKRIPANQMVVLMMHVPLVDQQGRRALAAGNAGASVDDVRDREALFRLIEKRPFALSIAGHTHYQEHVFLGDNHGWKGPQKHHHVVMATACGSWWSGIPDEMGIPHTTMRDGAPNGVGFITFDGNKYSMEFKAARRPQEHQMAIFVKENVAAKESAQTLVTVNYFFGSQRSKVEMRVDDGAWKTMPQVLRADPFYQSAVELETKAAEGKGNPLSLWGARKLPNPIASPHIWEAALGAPLLPGVHRVEVRATDQWGKVYSDRRSFRVE